MELTRHPAVRTEERARVLQTAGALAIAAVPELTAAHLRHRLDPLMRHNNAKTLCIRHSDIDSILLTPGVPPR